jgi:hypothetical protein
MARKKKSYIQQLLGGKGKNKHNRVYIALVLGALLAINTRSTGEPDSTVDPLKVSQEQQISLNEFLDAYQAGEYERVELLDEVHLQ